METGSPSLEGMILAPLILCIGLPGPGPGVPGLFPGPPPLELGNDLACGVCVHGSRWGEGEIARGPELPVPLGKEGRVGEVRNAISIEVD